METQQEAQHIIILGPAHPLRGGGITTFNQRLCREFNDMGKKCEIWSFSLQYPSFLFPGSSQYTNEPAPEGITIKTLINSINPFNWLSVGRKLRRAQPDLIIVRYWMPFMGPCLGTILRIARKNQHSKIVCIADNVIPHEKRPGDALFTRYFIQPIDTFITMSEKVFTDLRSFTQTKSAALVPHPLYDNFGNKISMAEARSFLKLNEKDNILLFFGFIRKYKGLDILLEAMALLKDYPVKLMIAGEYYEDANWYEEKIETLQIREKLILHTHFIADCEVKYYLCAADGVIQPYRHATQSGVTPLAYHFEKPMIVTDVGGLPDLVPDGKVGLVATPTPESLAEKIRQFFQSGSESFLPALLEEKKKYSWRNLTRHILDYSQKTHQ